MSDLQNFHGAAMFAAYFASGLVMLAIFTRFYLWITPYDEGKEIRNGRMAPAIALTGAMLGFTFPMVVASYAHARFDEFLAWGAVSCIVQLLVFGALHRLLPRMIETNNAAGATCFAAASICVGLINAASFVP
jgi:putative membrane protein